MVELPLRVGDERKTAVVTRWDLVRLMRDVRGVIQEQRLRGVVRVEHAQRLLLEQVLLIRRTRASVGGLRRAIVLPQIDARHVPGWALRVRRVGRAAALLPRPVVVGMMVVDEARVEPAPARSVLRRRHTSVPCQHPSREIQSPPSMLRATYTFRRRATRSWPS